jgi:hypothetical protein
MAAAVLTIAGRNEAAGLGGAAETASESDGIDEV